MDEQVKPTTMSAAREAATRIVAWADEKKSTLPDSSRVSWPLPLWDNVSTWQVVEMARSIITLPDASTEDGSRDAARGRYVVQHGGWLRTEKRDHFDYLTIPVAKGADLSCIATRRDALDAAMAAAVSGSEEVGGGN